MTDDAGVQGAGVSLPGDELDVVVRFGARCDGVGAIVAGLAIICRINMCRAFTHRDGVVMTGNTATHYLRVINSRCRDRYPRRCVSVTGLA